jgi:hypothetical protein
MQLLSYVEEELLQLGKISGQGINVWIIGFLGFPGIGSINC